MRKIYFYNPETKEAVYKITENGKAFIGKARPHPDDFEYASEYTGLTIAEYRARIKRNDYKLRQSKNRCKKLRHELDQELNNTKYYLEKQENFKKELEDYLDKKEVFLTKLKAARKRTAEAKELLEKAIKLQKQEEKKPIKKHKKRKKVKKIK